MQDSSSTSSFVKHAVLVDTEGSPNPDSSFSDTHSEVFSPSNDSSSEEPSPINHPFYKIPTHPLLLPPSVLNQKVKPAPLSELWGPDTIIPFIIEVMGALPTTHNYHEGIHLCRTIFVDKYGFGRYMDNMALFWGLFHDTYMSRDSDPHSASWSRWRHDRKKELEHVFCHSYVWGCEEGGAYLEEYINFKPGESGQSHEEEQEFLRNYGAKVTRFEVGWIGIENCNPEWVEQNPQNTSEYNLSSKPISPLSSRRLSTDFAISTLSLTSAHVRRLFSRQSTEFARSGVAEMVTVPQWESDNQTHALNLFAARKHRTLSQDDNRRSDLWQEGGRAVSIHRSNSVWKEAKKFLRKRSNSGKKRVVSGPINVTRGPSLPVTLLPIVSPAPELSKRNQEEVLHSGDPLHRPTGSRYITDLPMPTESPQCFQGSLYGQLEDILVNSVNKFLRSHVSCVTDESIVKELEAMESESRRLIHPSGDKSWFHHLREKLTIMGKIKIDINGKDNIWFNSQQWGVISGYRLVQANSRTLRFHGHHAASPTYVFTLWGQLIMEAFSGGRTRFEESTVMGHLETAEYVLELFGYVTELKELKKMKHEALTVFKQDWTIVPGVVESPTSPNTLFKPSRMPASMQLPPTRSSSLPKVRRFNRPRSLNNSVNAVWNELGGSYASTPRLPPLDMEDMQDSPCYGKGRSKPRAIDELDEENPVESTNKTYERGTEINQEADMLRRKENERANTLQTLLGNQRPVIESSSRVAPAMSGRMKEVRFLDHEKRSD